MKFGVPWSVKGIRPEARETAREAARRSGMSLGDWLNSVILEQAQDGRAPDEDDDESYGDELASVHQRLDGLTRRIEQFTRKGPEAYAPRHHQQQQPQRSEPDQIAQLIDRLDRRIDQFATMARQMPQPVAVHPVTAYPAAAHHPMMAPPLAPAADPYAVASTQVPPALDRAMAEIAARQRSLNGEPPAGRRPEPYQAPIPAAVSARAPVPSQDISGLEEQLRKITDQIETLRRPGVEEAINALRGELGDIGRALSDAMPKRTLDTLEKQIQGLTQRVVEGRQSGADGSAAAGVEHALAEVRDALRTLTPAENLIGFQEAVMGLAQKIDLIVAQKDPATLHQLESAITTLRGMAGNVASNEAVGRLAHEVQGLADKVDHIASSPSSDVLHNLESRIDALSRALAERAQNGNVVPPRLEALVQSLSDKIEQVHEIQHAQHAQGDHVAVNHLEDRIAGLVQKLDASEGRLGHLEAVERGLADLLVHIQDIQTKGGTPGGIEPSPAVNELKFDIARTHDALDAVHGTLGMLVDRMSVLEKNMRAPAQPSHFADEAELRQPPGKVAVRVVEAPPAPAAMEPPRPVRLPQAASFDVQPPPVETMPSPVRAAAPPVQPPVQPQPVPAPKRMPAALQMPIDPDLPPDQPLEPGSGRPAFQDPAERIAASEAALGGARPAAGGRSNFIAAARRAAQAALQQQPKAAPAPEPEIDEAFDEPADGRPKRARMLKRMKSLFVAASIVALVVGSIQIAGNMFGLGKSGTATTQKAARTVQKAEKETAQAVANPATAPGYNMLSPLQTTAITSLPPANPNPGVRSAESLLSPPALPSGGGGSDGNDITGSIPQRAEREAPAATTDAKSDRLPAAIGSAELRAAAHAGNAAAAYEIGIRYAEGRGVTADLAEAARWYERSAAKGLAAAQFRYASMLEKGQGVRKDLAHARKLYIAAAGQGNAKAMHNLAVLYAEGIDGRPDYGTASKWFHKAAEYGVSDSQYNLGILYARGIGVEKDIGESYKWFALAANGGDRESAKKRDELAVHLDPVELASAQREIQTFKVAPQPEAATSVPAPQGGWDKGASAAPAPKPRQVGAPMVIGKR
jgi:localization factor PodJL